MAKTVLRSPSGLYPNLLGASWQDLDNSVRRLHDSGMTVSAVGVFRVRHGDNSLARALARLALLPAPGETVNVRLQVTEWEEGEIWSRTFAGHPLVSRQYSRSDGLLAEQIGITEVLFRLGIVGGSLNYQTAGAALRLGFVRVPLPSWLSPRITAWERATGEMNRVQVSVDVSLPLLGRLIVYEGMLAQVEEKQL